MTAIDILDQYKDGKLTHKEAVVYLAQHFMFGNNFSDGVDLCANCGRQTEDYDEPCEHCGFDNSIEERFV